MKLNLKTILAVIALSLFSAMAGVGIYKIFEKKYEFLVRSEGAPVRFSSYDDALWSGELQRRFLTSSPTNFIHAAEATTPAAVNITAMQGIDLNLWDSETSIGIASGSGVIISPDGYIITNCHVVEPGADIEVTLNDKRSFTANVVGRDLSTDIALLKINATKLPHLVFGNSDSLRVGEWVLAVGNPFNLESTVTAGIVSAKGRSLNILDDAYSIESFIQTDAAVNPGNSGGALVNTNGELVGINTAIITKSGRYEGYSFAVPSNLVQKVIRDLRDFGTAQRGVLGVNMSNVTGKIAEDLQLPSAEGVVVQRVIPNSGAADAKMQEGDVIVAINGAKIRATPDLQEQIGRFRPGNRIEIEFIRAKKREKVTVTLKNKGNTTDLIAANNDEAGTKILQNIGFDLRELTREEMRRMRLPSGIYVSSIIVGSRVERTNMDPGFVITKVNEQKIGSVAELVEILGKATGKIVIEGVYENFPGEYYYAFAM